MKKIEKKAIKPTCDRKTQFYDTQRNTFGLLPGLQGTCPGCTTAKGGCGYIAPGRKTSTCYVDSLMRCYGGIKGVLEHNTALMKSSTVDEMTALITAEFTRFEATEQKRVAADKKPELYYRLHWSGDVFNAEYAEALKRAMLQHPNINFWSYTRTWHILPILATVPNLKLYLSLDPVNALSGIVAYDEVNGSRNPNLQLCYMNVEDDFEALKPAALTLLNARNEIRRLLGSQQHDTNWLAQLKLRVCPVDAGTSDLIRGCADCRACLTRGTAPVWFKS